MQVIPKLRLECRHCGHIGELDGAQLEQRLGEPLSLKSIGLLYGKLRCSNCSRRELQLYDDAGRLLINSTSITPCKGCGQVIPLPRLAAMPGSKICVTCATEGAKRPPDPAYPQPPADRQRCPRC